ncbi:hypothetical protein Ocepr_2380 (plasmid) [Oceanithermus profundus DSM 14977]|uniref:Uncharacterized protein n=1 Tax=Oceanithermus profundus (strain DSM 14977 / NBRC 100410 / VKM B-2274 / 506) TaxID=670487 RepID=E4UAP9_OCEP5|nr:hypothetical protein [Oceanithermus profundus]ADR37828.1 hypothetical protein Ocepr_2380 [Oceanithermus profundus DSM 14977]
MSLEGSQKLAEIQARGFRVGYERHPSGGWCANALYDDHIMYVGAGPTKEDALADLHWQVATRASRRAGVERAAS